MKRKEVCILTNMCMIYNEDKILVQDRLNPNWPGITFPGGHVELNESFVESTIREMKEETGLKVTNLKLCGIKQWNESNGEYNRYIVVLFKTNSFEGELKSSSEGKVFWIKKDELSKYKLAPGFESLLEVFFNDDVNENFHYIENDKWLSKNL